MRKLILIFNVILFSSCSGMDRDLWSYYDALPLEVETLEDPANQWVYDHFPLTDGSYLISRRTEETYFTQKCDKNDDSVLFSFPQSSYRLQGATLANNSLYILSADYETYPHVENPYKLSKLNDETMELEKEILFNIENRNGVAMSLMHEEDAILLVCRGDTTFISEYSFDLEWISTYDFAFLEDESSGITLPSLSNEHTTLLTENGLYFVFEQSLFFKNAQTVTQFPYHSVASILEYEASQLRFLQYDYSQRSEAEHLYVDRVTLDSTHQEISHDRLLSIGEPYLEISRDQYNCALDAFAFFDGDLFFIGDRVDEESFSPYLDCGILRLNLATSEVATYFKTGERASFQSTFYYNGHFGYVSYANDTETTRQINFRVASA